MNSASKTCSSWMAPVDSASASAIIRHHSKSFALASRLLGADTRDQAHALYAYCRRADDAIDLAAPGQAQYALERLRRELDAVYDGGALSEPIAAQFQRLVFERNIPRAYPDALLHGFELDARGASYASMFDLYQYCWCVAGSVGAMMCHVLGVRRESAVLHGVHLGMGMQLTNICRDVAEDWARGRLYVPAELLAGHGPSDSWPPPPRTLELLAHAVERLLQEADVFYRSGDRGLLDLTRRNRLAVATARRVYSSIGHRLRARHCDVSQGRVAVPLHRKLWCVARAAVACVRAGASADQSRAPQRVVRFPEDVLPV